MSIKGGIDLGGTKIQAAIVDDDHRVLGSARRATPTAGGPADVAGEIGHVVVQIDGARCTCGRRGCMEAYAGRAAMERRVRALHEEKGRKTELFELMKEHGRTRLTSGIWARALERGDRLAKSTIDRAVRALGAGVASAVNVLDVECVIIGGGLGLRLGDPYVKRISRAMQPHLFIDSRPPAVLLAELGDLGGAIGAALLGESC